MIRTSLVRENGLGGIRNENRIVLFTSDLLKEGSPFPALLGQDGQFELLAPDNYAEAPDKIRHTTMLKAKGLESDAVGFLSSDSNILLYLCQKVQIFAVRVALSSLLISLVIMLWCMEFSNRYKS